MADIGEFKSARKLALGPLLNAMAIAVVYSTIFATISLATDQSWHHGRELVVAGFLVVLTVPIPLLTILRLMAQRRFTFRPGVAVRIVIDGERTRPDVIGWNRVTSVREFFRFSPCGSRAIRSSSSRSARSMMPGRRAISFPGLHGATARLRIRVSILAFSNLGLAFTIAFWLSSPRLHDTFISQ